MADQRFLLRLIFIVAALMVLSACQIGADTTPTAAPLTGAAPTPTLAGTAPPATTETTALPEPTGVCPEATADTAVYRSDANGYCFLYPASFTVEQQIERPDEEVWLLGPQLVQGQEAAIVTLRIAFNGPATTLNSAEEYAEMWKSLALPELELDVQPATVGGLPAALITGIPGMFPEQSAFILANGMKYRLTLQPLPEDVPELTEAANQVWQTVTSSIVFFAPGLVRDYIQPEDVCPAATETTQTHTNLLEGFCLLYPASFELDERFASGFVGGPVIVDDPTFGEIRTSLVLASAGPSQGATPRQLLEPRLEFVDPASIQETTIGGAPAVTFLDPREPFASRQAMIVANDMMYTIVNQPYDPATYPKAVEHVDLVWETVVGSVAFFEPWR